MNFLERGRPDLFRAVAITLLLNFVVPTAWTAEPASPVFGRNSYIEYQPGELPIVISAPHGGRERPEEIPDRTKGVLAMDTNTQELARAVADEFFARTGQRPHLILCRLQRRKLDCNREIVEAAAGHPVAGQAWREYHGFIETARATVVAKYGRGFYVDLHGHAHKEQRLELGYLLDAAQLAHSDAELRQGDFSAKSSLRRLVADRPTGFPELLRGPRSFGASLEKEGFPCSPSPGNPSPPVPFFRGGYSVQRHAAEADHFAGLQIETYFKGVRDNAASRTDFSRALVQATTIFLAEQMKLTLPDASPSKSAASSK